MQNHESSALKGFIFDLNKCVGCQACSVACSIENNDGQPLNWRKINSSNPFRFSNLPLVYLSLACNHCQDAPCMKACPTKAYSRNPISNAVIIDTSKCMGCNYCSWVCPYDAPKMKEEGVMQKCTFCTNRLENDKNPACATNCPVSALNYGDIVRNSDKINGFSDADIKPNIEIITIRKGHEQPEFDHELIANHKGFIQPKSKNRIEVKKEWPLLIFTLTIPLTVAIYIANIFSGLFIDLKFYAILGGIGPVLSLFHLSNKKNAFRAFFNFNHSWLSREIFMYSLFYTCSVLSFFINDINIFIVVTIILLGWLSVFSVDMVYRKMALQKPYQIHSSETMLTLMLFVSLFLNFMWPFLLVLFIKNFYYLYRRIGKGKHHNLNNISLAVVKITIGFIIPIITLLFPFISLWVFILCLLISEVIDRFEFYDDLNLISPQWQLEKDYYQL